jgi:hypothetical protein
VKAKFIFQAILLPWMFSTNIYATCSDCNLQGNSSEAVLPRKIYVQEQQIAFSESKIYVNIDSNTFLIPAIYSDENGYFILTKQPGGRCERWEWKCGNCGKCNDLADYHCWNCNEEME